MTTTLHQRLAILNRISECLLWILCRTHRSKQPLRRVPSDDLDLMITAINVQHEIGGNLAEILEIIGFVIRERVRIKGEIAVLKAALKKGV